MIRVLTEEELQKKIDKAIVNFQRAVEYWDAPPHGKLGKLWKFLHDNGPCTYREIGKLLQSLHPNSNSLWINWEASSRLAAFEQRGWAKVVGHLPSSYKNIEGALIYEAIIKPLSQRAVNNIEKARNRLYKDVDRWVHQANTIPNCLMNRINPIKIGNIRYIDRNWEIIDLRIVEKKSLREIGNRYNISRERVRQIIARATGLEKKKIRHKEL